jgi:tetratricopeptide (TPR) repeat protein
MSSSRTQGPITAASFDERLGILADELELAVKWQRPCILLVVYSSEYVRADVETALENCLIDLGQRSVHLSVRDRDPRDVIPFLREFRDPAQAVFVIDGLRWGKGDESTVYSTISVQWEYFVERHIRTVFWLTTNELVKLAHAAPDFWLHRHRVIEFVDSPQADQVLRQVVDSTWQGTGEYAAELADTDAKITLRESMLTDLPDGEEAISIRGNLLLTLGVLNWRKGDFEKADEQLREALKIATKIQDNWFEAECFNALALIKSSTERIDEAIDAYKQAIELAPDQMFVWNNLGNLCARVGRDDEALIAFRKGLEGNPRDSIAWTGLANLDFKLGYVDDAIAAYRRAIQYTPAFAQPWCGLGDVYASIGRADEALKCFHKSIELNKQYVTPWIRLAALFVRQERHREAIRAYRKALEIDPRSSQTWNDLGTAYAKAENYDDAAEAFSKAIELDRGNGWAYSNLAHAYMQQGKHKETVSLLLRSIDLLESDADKAVSWNRLASIYRLLNDYDNAVAAYEMADKLNGTATAPADKQSKPEAIAGHAVPRVTASEPEPAKHVAAKVEERGPAHAEAAKPKTAERQPKDEPSTDAPAWIFEALKAEEPTKSGRPPENIDRGLRRWRLTQEKKRLEEQREEQVQASTEDAAPTPQAKPTNAAEWNARGNAFFTDGNHAKAAEAYNKAIQLDSAYGAAYSNLALTYLTQGQFAEAILLYQKSIEYLESDRDKALSWNGLGNAYRCTNDYTNAVAAYQQAAQLDPETSGIRERPDDSGAKPGPKSAEAWNELGTLLLKTGSADKAAAAFQKAIELEPQEGAAYGNLARATAAMGKYKQAVPLYEKSIELLNDEKAQADAWNGLGNAFRKLNDYENAIRCYQKAVVLADEGVDLLTRTRFSLLSNCIVNP